MLLRNLTANNQEKFLINLTANNLEVLVSPKLNVYVKNFFKVLTYVIEKNVKQPIFKMYQNMDNREQDKSYIIYHTGKYI